MVPSARPRERVVEERGKVTEADLEAVRNAGYNDKQVHSSAVPMGIVMIAAILVA
jgi:hypothetical protein